MTEKRYSSANAEMHPEAQPEMGYDRLFNLMLAAQERGELFVIFDECENTFEHRNIHILSHSEQRKLYLAARDEIARRRMKYHWPAIDSAQGTLQ